MSGINQLFKGVIIGIVLLLAVIGLLNISGKNNKVAPQPEELPAPTISVNTSGNSSQTDTVNKTKSPDNPNHIPDLSTPDTSTQSNTQGSRVENTNGKTKDAYKPEIIEEPVAYGTLNISAKQSGSGSPQKVDFLIYDQNNKQVATSKDIATASFHLPTGRYTAVTLIEDQRRTQIIEVTRNKTSSRIVEVRAPITTGVIQVSAVLGNTKKPQKTNFLILDQNGKTVGQRQQVSSTLFKLNAGTYKILATLATKDGELNEERTVVIEAGSSSKETFRLKTSPVATGKIIVKAVEEGTNKSVNVDFVITDQNGKLVKKFNSVPNAELNLSVGRYQIRATGSTTQTSRLVTVNKGQNKSEIFRFQRPTPQAPTPPVEIVDSTKQPEETNNLPPATPEVVEKDVPTLSKGLIKLSSVSDTTKRPVRSNFYIQTLNGKHIAREIYKNSANFELEKGTYKITIKSKNMKTVTKTMTVDSGSKLNQIFSLRNITDSITDNIPANTAESTASVPPTPTRPEPVVNVPPTRNAPIYTDPKPPVVKQVNKPIGAGSLVLHMQPARNLKTSRNALLSNFEIKTKSGKKIAQINKVQQATVKLDVGEYVVTAKLRGRHKSKNFRIQNSQATRVSFTSSDFSSIKAQPNRSPRLGLLVSKVVDNHGRPLKGNLTVTNQKGKIVYRATNVSTANFKLPAQPYTVSIKHNGLSGSERVNIIAGETTIQTFTIAPNPPQRANHSRNNRQSNTPSSRELRDALKDKLKEELERFVR